MKTQLAHARKMSLGQKIGWAFLMLLAIYPVLLSSGYLTMNPENFFEQQRAVYIAHLAFLIVYVRDGVCVAQVIGDLLRVGVNDGTGACGRSNS